MSIKLRRRLLVWRALLCVSFVAHLVITILQPDVGMVCLWVWLAINWLSLELIWAVELLLTYTKGDCGPPGPPGPMGARGEPSGATQSTDALLSEMNDIERTKHMEYQVGDYAYIRKDLVPGEQYSGITLRNHMIPADRRVQIRSVDTSDNTYLAAVGYERYWYSAEMFESKQKRVSLSQKIVVTTDGKVTTATLYDGKTKRNVALASCNPRDEFDFGIGAQLAVERLFLPSHNVMQKPCGVNGYAVCNRTEEGLTQGNVYRIRDGFFVDDDDDRRPMTDIGFASADEVNGWHDGSLTLLSGEALQMLGVQD